MRRLLSIRKGASVIPAAEVAAETVECWRERCQELQATITELRIANEKLRGRLHDRSSS